MMIMYKTNIFRHPMKLKIIFDQFLPPFGIKRVLTSNAAIFKVQGSWNMNKVTIAVIDSSLVAINNVKTEKLDVLNYY